MNYDTQIKHLASGLPYLASGRYICPACGGGASHEKSLSVTRSSTGILYKCFRANCVDHLKGFIATIIGDPVPQHTPKPKVVSKAFTRPLRALDSSDLLWFWQNFNITARAMMESGTKWCPSMCRFIYPVHGPNKEEYGVVARTYIKGDVPKTINYQEDTNHEFISWHIVNRALGYAFIVEDWVSAYKLYSCGYNAISLLGHTLNNERIHAIRQVFPNVVLWLDQDVYMKSLEYKQQYGIFFNKFEVYMTSSDPKDIHRPVLDEYLKQVDEDLMGERNNVASE